MTDARHEGAVLVVDDDADVRETVADVVEASGRRVFTARDGVEALEKLDRDGIPRPCLVLLDWQMVPMGGEEFLRCLRERADAVQLPVVIISASDRHVPAEEHRSPVLGVLSKPFGVEELLAALDQHG